MIQRENNIQNLQMDESDFELMLNPYLKGVEVYDPELGAQFRVFGLKVINDDLFAVVENNALIYLNLADEFIWIKDVLLENKIEFKNKKELLKYIEKNIEEVNNLFKTESILLEIDDVKNGKTIGSISTWNIQNISNQFFYQIKLNKILEKEKRNYSSREIEEARHEQRYYPCKIVDMNKGGFLGYVYGVQVFIPGSLASFNQIEDYSEMIGKEIPVMIDSFMKERNIFIASHKKYIKLIIPATVESLDKNQKLNGKITGISKFGIFISFNDFLNGLLHVSEMEEETLKNFNEENYKVGDEISFYIKTTNNEKIVLSDKSFENISNDWDLFQKKYLDKIIKRKVFKRIQSGFLFDIGDGFKGLLYDIEARKYNQYIEVDKEYEVYVSKMDFESSKIFLKFPLKEKE